MCEERILIDPNQVQAYAQVVVQAAKQAGEAVGDEFLLGPTQQDFCACGELRSTIPWLDSELTEIHDQVLKGVNRIASASVDALHRALSLRQEQNVGTDVSAPGAAVTTNPSVISVSPQVSDAVGTVGTMTSAQLSNYLANQQYGTQQFIKMMNMEDTPNAMFLPEGVDPVGFDSDGNEHYTGPTGIGDSTDPLSLDLE